MKKTRILTLGLAMLASATAAQADLLKATSFEDSPGELGFVTSIVVPDPIPSGVWWVYPSGAAPSTGQSDASIFATDGNNDYFTVTYPGVNDLVAASNPDLTGRDGAAEFTAEDVSKDGISSGTASITFDPVVINGYTNVQVKMLLGASDAAAFETSDFIRIEAKTAGEPTARIGHFLGNVSGDMAQDADLDDTAEGTALGLAYQEFTFDVPAGWLDVQVELDISVDGDEEVFLDNVRIEGTPGGPVRDPIGTVDVATLDLGRVAPGQVVDSTVTVSNHASASQNLSILNTSSFSGTDAGYFSIVDALPISVAPGASQDLTVRFTAPAGGGIIADDATLTIVTNDNLSPSSAITLSGRVPGTTTATVTVSGVDNIPTSFDTIVSAVNWLSTNHLGQPWEINVTTDGPAVEPSAIDLTTAAFGGVTINGDADGNGTPYTIITDAATAGSQANYSIGATYAAMSIEADAANYTLRDLTFMPAFVAADSTLDDTVGGSFGVRAITIDDYGNDIATAKTVLFEDITIGGSKAGNVLAADPDNNEFTSVTRYGRGINIFSSGDPGAAISNTYTFNNVRIFNTQAEVFNSSADYADVTIGAGCIFAWSGESVFVASGSQSATLNMNGSSFARILLRGSGLIDLDEESGAVVPTENFVWGNMSYVDVIDNGAEFDFGPGQGPDVMEYCRFAFNDETNDDADGTDTGLRYGYAYTPAVSATTSRIIRNVTIHDGLNPAGTQYGLNFVGRPDGMTFNVSNTIFSGAGDTGVFMRDGGESTLNLDSVALVGAGPDALAAQFDGVYDGSPGNFTLVQVNVTTADPQYASTTYTYGASEDFLRPTNPAYLGAGVGGSDLLGGTVPLGTSVQDWTMY